MNCPLCQAGGCRALAAIHDDRLHIPFRCPGCQVEFLSPQPTDEDLAALYSKTYYDAWGLQDQAMAAAVEAMKDATFRLRLELIRRFTGGRRILDVGCATGFFLDAAAQDGFDAFGIEFSPYAASVAQARFGPDRVFQGVLEAAPFALGSFDAIAMSDLLEHVRDPLATLVSAARLLKPGGVLMIMTPDTGSLTHRLQGRRWLHYKTEHLFYFNRYAMARLAAAAGLVSLHNEAARKCLSLAFAHRQFGSYPHPLFTPLTAAMARFLPDTLFRRNLFLTIGERVWVLARPAQSGNSHG